MYDYAHGQSDSIERITHSMCTLEFEDHRPALRLVHRAARHLPFAADRIRPPQPHLHAHEQAQAAQAGAGKTRHRLGRSAHAHAFRHAPPRLHGGGHPQFLRRRRRVANNGIVDLAMLEHFVREDLNKRAPRVMAVLRPLKIVIDNYPEGQTEEMEAVTIPRTRRLGRAKCRSRRCSTSSTTISAKSRRRSTTGFRPAWKSACAMAISSTAKSVVKNDNRRSGRSALHLRSRHARRQRVRWPQGEIDHPLGLSRACHRRRGAALRQTFQQGKSR